VNERDQLLRMVKGLQPKLVTLVEQDANTNTAPFLTRLVTLEVIFLKSALDYYILRVMLLHLTIILFQLFNPYQ